jgi:hypothetical protein
MEAQLPPLYFLPHHWRFWSKVRWQGECATPFGHNMKILQVFVQFGQGTILQTHLKVGLRWAQGAPFDANIHLEGPKMFPAPPTPNPTGPATPQHQEDIQRKRMIHKTNQHNTIIRQSQKEVNPRRNRSVFVFGTSNQWNNAHPPSALASKQAVNHGEMPPIP